VSHSVVGDLVERYGHQSSVTWYWRQTLTAIVMGAWHEMRTSRLMAIRAIVVGCLVSEAFMYSTGAFVTRVVPGYSLVLLSSCFFCAAGAGWLVSQSHPRMLVIVVVGFILVASVTTFGVYALLPLMDRQPFPVLAFFLTLDFVVLPLGILTGGVVGGPSVTGRHRLILPE
jgi:hypothetical protein